MTIFQVGVGSGGIVVLDHLIRELAVTKVILIDPDVYKTKNTRRHLFLPSGVGRLKVDLAAEWVAEFNPAIEVVTLAVDITDPDTQEKLNNLVSESDIGVCAVDSEPAKFHFDVLLRQHRKPWTMGEVLSGGIGGWVHQFAPDGPCYGCVASFLNREMQTDRTLPPSDYADPAAQVPETTVPASWNSIGIIAGLHARMTLDLAQGKEWDFTSLLTGLCKVENIFAAPMQTFKFRIARMPDCLVCGPDRDDGLSGVQLDVALDHALARLAHE